MTNILLTFIVGMGLVFCGFWLGKGHWFRLATDRTLDLLMNTGYLKYRRKANGELELIKIDNPPTE